MDTRTRLNTLKLIEKMSAREDYAGKLGLNDRSTLHGEPINNKKKTGSVKDNKEK